MDPNKSIPWLAMTKLAANKMVSDLSNKFITNADVEVLMFILKKMGIQNTYKSPSQEELQKSLNLSTHRLSDAYTKLKQRGYFVRTDVAKTYMVNPYLFYIGNVSFLTSKKKKWQKFWENYLDKCKKKNIKINDDLEKYMTSNFAK